MEDFEKDEREYQKRVKQDERRHDRNFINTIALFGLYFMFADFVQSLLQLNSFHSFERNMVYAIIATIAIRHQTDKKNVLVLGGELHPRTSGALIIGGIIVAILLKIYYPY